MRADPPQIACDPPRDNDAIVVLGIGNVLWADEGFGVRCVEALQQRYDFAPHVQLVDGGTQGLYLIQHVQAARRLLIFDAIDYGLAPGTLQVIENDDVPAFLGAKKMSLHQTGFQEVLMLARLTGHYPDAIVLIGCQPEELEDYGGSLRPCVKTALEDALALGVERLRGWGACPQPRSAPPADPVTLASIAMGPYEAERPAAELACRVGDARFMPQHPVRPEVSKDPAEALSRSTCGRTAIRPSIPQGERA